MAPREERIKGHLREAKVDFLASLKNLYCVLAITYYHYLYWPSKAKIRNHSRKIAHTVCSISLLILLAEVAVKLGADPLLSVTVKSFSSFKYWVGGLVFLAVLILLLHSLVEMRRAHLDEALSDSLWALHFAKRPPTESEYVQEILRVTVGTFKKYGAFRACIWIKVPGENKLRIPKHFVYPESEQEVLRELDLFSAEKSCGVAAIVHHDGKVRYSPRLRFPWDITWLRQMTIFFLHSVVFEPVIVAAENGKEYMEVKDHDLERDGVYVKGLAAGPDMKAFISVPITTYRDSCLGVLCIDFSRPDPLTKSDIKAVTTIGFSIGAELERYQRQRQRGEGDPGDPSSFFPDLDGGKPKGA